MLSPSATVKAVASLSVGNQSFTNWPLCSLPREIHRTRTARLRPSARLGTPGRGPWARALRVLGTPLGSGARGELPRSRRLPPLPPPSCPAGLRQERPAPAPEGRLLPQRRTLGATSASKFITGLWPCCAPRVAQHDPVIHLDKTASRNPATWCTLRGDGEARLLCGTRPGEVRFKFKLFRF